MQTELRELNALREEFRNQRAHLDYQSDEEGDDFDDWWHHQTVLCTQHTEILLN